MRLFSGAFSIRCCCAGPRRMSSSTSSSASATSNLTFDIEVIERFIEKHYRKTGKVFRRCHPRDLLSHALNLINFEKLPLELTAGVLERAFESCFLAEDENAAVPSTAIVRPKP